MLKNNIIKTSACLFFIIIGFFVGYFLKRPTIITSIQEKGAVKQEIPECFLGICPKYFSMDVDGDDLSESLVIIPTAMTKGAGKLWIIDEGKVIFKTNEMANIWIKQSSEDAETGNKFTLLYANGTDLNNDAEIKYVYKNGQFKPE